MHIVKKLLRYLNPINRLGIKRYSVLFPLLTILLVTVIVEFIVYSILRDPMAVGNVAIFLYVGLIIYFAFHDGVRGGFVAASLTSLLFNNNSRVILYHAIIFCISKKYYSYC